MTPSSRPDDPGPTRAAGADSDFFDAAYYRLLEPFHTEAEARYETAALRELLGLAQGDRILDLGCGWGRHLRLLAAAGHDVVGLDLSVPLLRRARRRDVDDGPDSETGEDSEPPRRVPLVAADMRTLPLADETFDAILNLATSLGLFTADPPAVRALAEMARALRPDGKLLLEGMHRADVEAHFASRDAWTLRDGTRVRVRRRFDPRRGVSHEVMRWDGPEGKGRKRHSLRIRTADEVERLLEAAGLRLDARYGGWDGRPFRPDAPRLIAVARIA